MSTSPAPAPKRALSIVVVGQGYVGLPLAMAFAEDGHRVVGLDADTEKVNALRAGRALNAPRGLTGMFELGRYHPSDDPGVLALAEVVIICVPTPLDAAGRPDPSAVLNVAQAVRERTQAHALVILESTVAPGFVEGPFSAVLVPGGHRIAYAPERIDPGPARPELRSVPRLVAGLTSRAAEEAADLYRSLGIKVHAVSVAVAAWAKLLENTYRLVNVALVGELAAACAAAGVNIDAVIDAAATKPFGFAAFRPGAGAGGHCVPVDPVYLADHLAALGVQAPLLRAAIEANAERPRAVARAITAQLPRSPGRILLVGAAYKPDLSDTRMTPARPIRDLLKSLGHEVSFHDPLVPELDGQHSVPLTEASLRAFDVAAVLVGHQRLDLSVMAAPICPIVDACGALASHDWSHVVRV